jgi:hypothetical protein
MGNRHSNVENPAPIYIGYGRRLSEKVPISAIHEQVVALRRTFQDVGVELFPEEHINVAQMAVSFAAREILSPEEYERIKARNFLEGASRGGLSHMPEGYVKNGAAERVDGKTKWNDAEETRLLELAASRQYTYPSGMHEGHPCFSMICAALNNEFHGGAHVRNGNNCFRKHKRLVEARSNDGTGDE